MSAVVVRRRPLVGPLMAAVGLVHVGITPLLFPEAVRGVLASGVLDAIEADPELAPLRGLGFWYATTGLSLLVSGWAVSALERRPEGAPRALPLVLTGLGLWGVVLMPRSPFWVFFVLAALSAVHGSRQRRTTLRPGEARPTSA